MLRHGERRVWEMTKGMKRCGGGTTGECEVVIGVRGTGVEKKGMKSCRVYGMVKRCGDGASKWVPTKLEDN